jgi:hypothetical protein
MIRSTWKSTSTRIPMLRGKCTLLTAIAGLVLAASSPILAQTSAAPAGGAISPAREGNVYGHKNHQPTQAEVSRAEVSAGIRPSSSGDAADIEKEVEELLKQVDELDRTFSR